MDRQQSFDRFQLKQDRVLNDQVNLVSTIQLEVLVDDWQIHLPLERESSQMQFVAETLFVGRFEKARTEMAVNFNSRTDDWTSSWVFAFLVFSVSLSLCG